MYKTAAARHIFAELHVPPTPEWEAKKRRMNSSNEGGDVVKDRRIRSVSESFDIAICFTEETNGYMQEQRRKIYENFTSTKDFREKVDVYDITFTKMFDNEKESTCLTYAKMIDLVIWFHRLHDSDLIQKVEYNDLNLMYNQCVMAFTRVVEKIDAKERQQASKRICDAAWLETFLYCLLRSKWYNMYRIAFDFQDFNDEFNRFLGATRTFYRRGADALRWIMELKLYSRHRPERLVTMALKENMLINLQHYYEAESSSNDQLRKDVENMVLFLDITVAKGRRAHLDNAWFHTGFDSVQKDCADMLLEKIRENTLTRTVFQWCKTFNLDQDYCKFSLFVRKLSSFFTIVVEYRKKMEMESEDDDNHFDIFAQQVKHLLKDCPLMRYAALQYLAPHSVGDAMFFALYLNIPRGDWPKNLKETATDHLWRDMTDLIVEYNKKIHEENMALKDGFYMNSDHRVMMIDTEEKLEKLKSFMDENKTLGFDAEWDQSYNAEQGILGIIQLSSKHETLLVDIEAFRHINRDSPKWVELFQIIFGSGNKIFGFAYESDLKTVVHNFPDVETIINDNIQNLVCIRNAMIAISANQNAIDALFERLPERQNLQTLTVELLGWEMEKVEQSSVWSERPLRRNQQMYAARDSLACLLIGEKFEEKLAPVIRDLTEIFQPLKVSFHPEQRREKRSEGKKYDALLAENKTESGKKTKSNHFTKEELISLINTINKDLKSRIPETELNNPEGLKFCADPMCSQISQVLRRCGISVKSDEYEKNYARLEYDPSVKVLTTGKFVAKYPPDQVVDLPASVATLDKQLATFMESQKLIIDTTNMIPRCCKCNSNSLCFVPTPVIRYLHATYAIANMHKMSHCSYSLEDMNEYHELCKTIRTRSPVGIVFCVFTPSRMVYVCSAAQIDMKKLTITKTLDFLPIVLEKREKPEVNESGEALDELPTVSRVQISLATHLNYKELDIPPGTMHAICAHCGKENVEAVLHPTKN
ncbi:unnamed protein product [Bursaphelenchus okinawaensis]|uniref:3'-5' exonuclease domain-containing protein n=1 Tax=Bursaphelenchus okinawaensis TaxID=465554 RepID=A0A811KML3_9BILA|nr:unnamed protein product [Bursaphelenchus okinawaensis]CAG9106743.1 unnamed protein product [Bursaphelenchus okinawaensis]